MNLYTKKKVWVTNPGKNMRKSEKINKINRLLDARRVVMSVKIKEDANKQVYARKMVK